MNEYYKELTKESLTKEEAFNRLIDIIELLRRECPWGQSTDT